MNITKTNRKVVVLTNRSPFSAEKEIYNKGAVIATESLSDFPVNLV